MAFHNEMSCQLFLSVNVTCHEKKRKWMVVVKSKIYHHPICYQNKNLKLPNSIPKSSSRHYRYVLLYQVLYLRSSQDLMMTGKRRHLKRRQIYTIVKFSNSSNVTKWYNQMVSANSLIIIDKKKPTQVDGHLGRKPSIELLYPKI